MEDENQNAIASMDEFKTAFGITTDPVEDPKPDETTPPDAQAPDENPEQSNEEVDPKKSVLDSKAAQNAGAFAKLRVTNSKYENVLKKAAATLGLANIDLSDPDKLISELEAKIVEATAKEQNVSPELLQKVADLEKSQEIYKQRELKDNALIGFQNVQNQFKLTNEDLEVFAEELINQGRNPFETKLDLISEYKMLHFDDLLKKASEQAVLTEAQRAAKAEQNSSTPSTVKGASSADSDDKKITSVKDLNAWFEKQIGGK